MDRQMAESLDQWITGNYGEDSLSGHDDECSVYIDCDANVEECSNLHCSCWCHRDDPEETYARLSMLEEEV